MHKRKRVPVDEGRLSDVWEPDHTGSHCAWFEAALRPLSIETRACLLHHAFELHRGQQAQQESQGENMWPQACCGQAGLHALRTMVTCPHSCRMIMHHDAECT